MAMTDQATEREYAHERLGARFQDALSTYDTQRRVDVLVDEFLDDAMLEGKHGLDVGCGLGFFSERVHARGAQVIACDLGPTLVERTRERVGCDAEVVDALQLVDHFGANRFDFVISSECIEHTRNPGEALRQMAEVLKPGGHLSVSTPSILWQPVVRLATTLRLRPFDGFEIFSSWRSIRRILDEAGVSVLKEKGLHLLPFQLPCHRFLHWCDEHLQGLRPLMINICVLGRKRATDDEVL